MACRNRDKCSSLCEKAVKYVDQDQVILKEIRIGNPVYGSKIEEIQVSDSLTVREGEILRLWVSGMNRREIRKLLNISTGSLRFHLFNINQKLKFSRLSPSKKS